MTQATLLNSIYTYLSTVNDLPDIFYPNTNQTTIPDEYLEVYVMPIAPTDIGVREVTYNSGIIQINVATKVNVGEIKAAQIADKIKTAFARGTVFSGIRIDKTPSISQGMNIDDKYKVPISITYNFMTA